MNISTFQDVLDSLRRLLAGDEPEGPRSRKRRRILEVAAELFGRHGYRRASISEVAKQAGVAKGTVYLYYPSKAELLLHVMLLERLRLYEQMAPVLAADQSPHDRLHGMLRNAVVHAHLMPISNRIKMGEPEFITALSELDLQVMWPVIQAFDHIMGWLIQEATPGTLPPDELHDRGHVLIAVLQAVPLIAHDRMLGAMTREVFANHLADLLVDGLTAPPRTTEEDSP